MSDTAFLLALPLSHCLLPLWQKGLLLLASLGAGVVMGALVNKHASACIRRSSAAEPPSTGLGHGLLQRVVAPLALGLAFPLLLWVEGLQAGSVAHAALCCILLGAALVDARTLTIPNGFVLAALALWVLYIASQAVSEALWSPSAPTPEGPEAHYALTGSGWRQQLAAGLAGAVLVGGGVFVFALALSAVTGRPSLGGGDVKLLFALGLYLGLYGSLLNLFLCCALGVAMALVQACLETARGTGHGRGAIPFGPAICGAAMVTLMAGPALLSSSMGPL